MSGQLAPATPGAPVLDPAEHCVRSLPHVQQEGGPPGCCQIRTQLRTFPAVELVTLQTWTGTVIMSS